MPKPKSVKVIDSEIKAKALELLGYMESEIKEPDTDDIAYIRNQIKQHTDKLLKLLKG